MKQCQKLLEDDRFRDNCTSGIRMGVIYIHLLCLCYDAFVVSRRDIVQCPLEMSLGVFKRGALLIGLEIRMNELDEPIQVLRCYLCSVSVSCLQTLKRAAYCLVLLIKVIYISIQNFDEQFN